LIWTSDGLISHRRHGEVAGEPGAEPVHPPLGWRRRRPGRRHPSASSSRCRTSRSRRTS